MNTSTIGRAISKEVSMSQSMRVNSIAGSITVTIPIMPVLVFEL